VKEFEMKYVRRQTWACLLKASVLSLVVLGGWSAQAEEVQVAVAANFAGPFTKIAADFAAETGHKAISITGSTGKFYTQIKEGAPFEVLLAADDETPKKLEDEGLAVKGQRFTYAKGKLVLWSAQPGLVDNQGEVLRKGTFARLALANPKVAPYGAAGIETLKAMGVYEAIAPKIVQGDNIAQAQQFVATGNVELGFVALSQVAPPDRPAVGSWWVVPAKLYTPILQDAALLKKGEQNAAAVALMKYLRGDKARAVIKSYGYEL
jgi:molybdate transport system substrate-binding protein